MIFKFIKKQWLFVLLAFLSLVSIAWTTFNLFTGQNNVYYIFILIMMLGSFLFFGAITLQLFKEYKEQLRKEDKGKYIPKDKRRK